MSDISTKAGVFETGKKDEFGVAYQGNRLISCSNKSLTEYSVREGTEVICDSAFMNAKDLLSIQLPKSIRAIGESAFAGCKSLHDINIPEGVTEIRQSTFRDCKSLGCLEVPASCIKIDKWAFSDGLETLVCNAPSMQIDKSAFFGCKTLATVMVPEGSAVTYAQALEDCRLTPDIEEMPTADSNETPCEYNTINNANQKETLMENLKVPGYSVLILSGKGYVLEVEGDINTIRYGILTKDYKITLNGIDVTKEVEIDNNKYAFMNKCFELQEYDEQLHLSEEMQLPPSIYLIPEDAIVNDVKLMSVGYAFPHEKNNLIVADFIFYEDEELESDSYRNEEELLKTFTSDDETYPNNAEWYYAHIGDEESFTLKWEGDDDDEDYDNDEDYDEYEDEE